MIGFYDYTVILTFLSLIVSVFGMTNALTGHFRLAIVCLALSGLLDAFDGKVARTKKNRTEQEKLYGIQLDSLADVVCFGIFPIMICYLMGVRGIIGYIGIFLYAVCGVTRLSYYNVLETERMQKQTKEEKVYHGLPITSIAVILPLTFLLSFITSQKAFVWILTAMLFIVAACFVIDFKIRALKPWMLAVLTVLVACVVIVIVLFSKYRKRGIPVEGPLYDKIMEDCADESDSKP